jgi:DNA replication and repair protein RecN
MADRLFLY